MSNIRSRSMSVHRLPEIVGLGYVPCRLLSPNIMLQAMTGQRVAVVAPITPINLIYQAVLSWEGSMVNNARQERATLKFITNDLIPDDEPLAFAVTTAAGKQYIVGKKEGRFPVISYADTTGQRAGDRAARTYTVTYIAPKAALECVV